MICFPVVVALKVIVPPLLNMEVELAKSEPAKVRLLEPIVKIELVAVPPIPAPYGRNKLPSTPAVPEEPFPWIVIAPPGANSEPGAT